MDVTAEILKHDQVYSASDNTNPDRYASGKVLNYASGASIKNADVEEISVVPYNLHYEDAVGLFGVENYFSRINLNVVGDIVLAEYMEPGYNAAKIDLFDTSVSPSYTLAAKDDDAPENDIDWNSAATPAITLPDIGTETYLSVQLINHETNNIYNDTHLDVRLYTSEHEEHPYDLMFIKPKDHFFVGIHARNTRRLPYNIEIKIGEEYTPLESITNRSYIMKSPDRPSY